jgi:hypothetical protein
MLSHPGHKAPTPGEPILRWNTRTHSIAGIEAELARIWASVSLETTGAAA